MNKNDNEKKKSVYNQLAWILNYKSKIEHQHIHFGNQKESDEVDDVEVVDAEYKEYEEVRNSELKTEEQNTSPVAMISDDKPPKLDTQTPEAKLIQMLNRDWFNECVTNKDLYTVSWRSKYVKALMKEFGTKIAIGWAGSGTRNKRNLIKGHILGALKKAGVIKGCNTHIANRAFNIGVNTSVNEGNKIAPYMSHRQGSDESKNNPYIDWTINYVENNC